MILAILHCAQNRRRETKRIHVSNYSKNALNISGWLFISSPWPSRSSMTTFCLRPPCLLLVFPKILI